MLAHVPGVTQLGSGSPGCMASECEWGSLLRAGWGARALRVLGVGPRSLDLISMPVHSPFK